MRGAPLITIVVGARPQFVKLAPLAPALRDLARTRIVHTGQHYDYDMSRQFFEELAIPEPDAHLGAGSGSHGEQLGRIMTAMERELSEHPPDWVLVFGDTNSTLGAALMASRAGRSLAHVEAGVRGFHRHEPEEVNRVLTDRLSDLLFVPSARAVRHLAAEGITRGVHEVGDVMVDGLQHALAVHGRGTERLAAAGVSPGAYTLATFHRPVNVDEDGPLGEIVEALIALEEPVLLPLHPRTRRRLAHTGGLEKLERSGNVTCLSPVGYLTMLAYLVNARRVLTDSGGLQKEAYVLRIPCITVSAQTAWEETVELGWNRLVPPNAGDIAAAISGFTGGQRHEPVYGRGDACGRIRDAFRAVLA